MGAWWDAVVPDGAVFFGQDWGSLVGLAVVTQRADRVRAIVIGNGILARKFKEQTGAFRAWQDHVAALEILECGRMVASILPDGLTEAERAAYDAPFPDKRYQASALEFPLLIPVQPDNPGVPQCRETWTYLEAWTKPFLTVFGTDDMVAYKPGAHRKLQRLIPGAQGLDHIEIEGANHFIQEDAPERLVEIIDTFVRTDAP